MPQTELALRANQVACPLAHKASANAAAELAQPGTARSIINVHMDMVVGWCMRPGPWHWHSTKDAKADPDALQALRP